MAYRRRSLSIIATVLATCLALSACSADSASEEKDNTQTTSAAESVDAGSTVVDLAGNKVEIPENPQSVIVTDNRSFQILQEWDVKLAAAPVQLMNEEIHARYIADNSIIDLGSHREPNMEGFVEAEPDLVINGQRFSGMEDEIKALLPEDAAYVDVNMPEDMPLDQYFHTQVALLGEIFDKQTEAAKMIADFDAAVEKAKSAYDSSQSVMGLVVSGGSVNYAAPTTGRSVGPLFPLLGLTPALEQEGTSDHEGDEVSLEAIAATDPQWLIVLDRDQSVSSDDENYTPSDEVIRGSEALKNVTAVLEDHIITAPAGFYVAEDIILYTKFLNDIAAKFDMSKNK